MLKSHINSVHYGKKDHKCDSCEKAFSQAWILKQHINSVHTKSVHENEKAHKCDDCGKSFTKKYVFIDLN